MSQNFAIPVKIETPQQRIQVELSGKTYILDLTWNSRAQCWVLDMYDSALNALILNKFLQDQTNAFMDQYWDTRIPPGALGIYSDVPNETPNFNNFGKSAKLYYNEF